MKKKYNFQTLALALTVALAAPTLTSCAQAQVNNPVAARQYKGEITGKVKWIHNSTWWFVLKADKAAPGAPSLVGPDLKIATSWVGANKPDPKQHEFIKSLKPGQKITVKVDGRANGDLILVGAPAIAATAPKANKNSAAMTDPNAKEGLSGYYQKLMFDELNGAPIKRWMFAKDEAAARKQFNLQKVAGAQGKVTDFKVEGQPFETATRIEITEKPKLFWHLNYTAFDNIGAEKDDLLWGVLYYRVTKAPEGAGQSRHYFVAGSQRQMGAAFDHSAFAAGISRVETLLFPDARQRRRGGSAVEQRRRRAADHRVRRHRSGQPRPRRQRRDLAQKRAEPQLQRPRNRGGLAQRSGGRASRKSAKAISPSKSWTRRANPFPTPT